MSEEAGQKEHAPTPQTLRRLRESGDVPQSRDLTIALLLLTSSAVLLFLGPRIGDRLEALFRYCLDAARRPADNATLIRDFQHGYTEAFALIVPLMAALFAVAVCINFLQVGPLFSTKTLALQPQRLNPAGGLKKIFFTSRTYVELAKSILKVILIGSICYLTLRAQFADYLRLPRAGIVEILALAGQGVMRCLWRVAGLFLGLAALDLLYQRWRYFQDHRLTTQQLKKELKETDSDPAHAAARQRMREEIMFLQMMEELPTASVVTVNPLHYACAIRFDPKKEDAPRLIAKGRGHIARKIREIAKARDIEIVRDPALARSLYNLKLNTQIPADLYTAAAQVLQWVQFVAQSRGQTPPWVQPTPPAETPTPESQPTI